MNPFKQKEELLSSLKELKQNEKLIICPGCEQKFTKEQLAEGMYVCRLAVITIIYQQNTD